MKEQIQEHIDEVIAMIREHSISQKANWQQIPALVLEADGRGGFLGMYEYAAMTGLWQIGHTYVDCETGRLVYPFPKTKGFDDAYDASVLQLFSNLDALDTERIISSLEENIQQWNDSPGAQKMRDRIQKEYGVTSPYKRSNASWDALLPDTRSAGEKIIGFWKNRQYQQ